MLFSPRSKIPDLEVLPQRVHCDAGGTAVMLKKGSNLAQWWNPAFQSLVDSGDYQKLCEESRIKYNGKWVEIVRMINKNLLLFCFHESLLQYIHTFYFSKILEIVRRNLFKRNFRTGSYYGVPTFFIKPRKIFRCLSRQKSHFAMHIFYHNMNILM